MCTSKVASPDRNLFSLHFFTKLSECLELDLSLFLTVEGQDYPDTLASEEIPTTYVSYYQGHDPHMLHNCLQSLLS